MNNTPPKYNEDINWKKYLEQSLQEQIKTTDAIENLPYKLNFDAITKSIDTGNKEIYKSINQDVTNSISNSIEKNNKKISEELSKQQPKTKTLKPDDVTKPIVESNISTTSKIIKLNKQVAQKTAQVMGEQIKDGYKEVGGVVGGHINDVVGSNIQRAYSESKVLGGYVLKLMGRLFSIFKSFNIKDKKETKMQDDISEFAEAATKKGSIYTHDITVEDLLKENNEYFKREEKRKLRTIKGKDESKGFWKELLTAALLFFGFLYGKVKGFSNLLTKWVFKPIKFKFGKIWIKISKIFKESKIGKSLLSLAEWFKDLGTNIITKLKGTKIGELLFTGLEKLWSVMGKMWEMIINSKIFKIWEWFKNVGNKMEAVPLSSMKKFPGLIGSIRNIISTMFSSISGFSKLKGIGKIIAKYMIRLKFIPFFIGELIGKIILPFQVAYDVIKGIFHKGSIRDKILAVSSNLLETVLMIPQMLGNAILWLLRKFFGEDFLKGFKYDFSAKKITEVVNNITKWVGTLIDPIIKFFGETLPNIFDKVKHYLSKQIDEAKFYLNPLNWFKGKSYEEARQGNRVDKKTGALLRNTGETEEEWQKRVFAWRKSLQTQKIQKPSILGIEDQQIEIAKNAYNKKQNQIKNQNDIQKNILKSNKELGEQNKNITQTIINTNNMISQNNNTPKEIPNNNENAILSLVSAGALQ